MKIDWKKLVSPLIIALLALTFFVATASFNLLTQTPNYVKWASPDETANYFFSKKLAEEGELAYFDEAAVIGNNIVMPRSLRSDFGWVKPVSFLGIILIYGSLGSVLGSAIIPFLTPLFAALGIIIFYLLVKRLFNNDRLALIAAFLLATFPVYIYYTVRSMFHNVLFIVFCLLAFYLLNLSLGRPRPRGIWRELKRKFFSFQLEKERLWQFLFVFLAGIAAGLAVITRTSELIWLVPSVGLLWLFYLRRFGFIKPLLFLAGLVLTVIPLVYWNNVLYDNSWRGGYNEMNRSLEEISVAGDQLVTGTLSGQLDVYKNYARTLFYNVFYFGFNKEQSIMMFERYVLEMFPSLIAVAIFGGFLLLIQNLRDFKKKYLAYFLVGGVLSIILIFYYGSWLFNDNPDPSRFTIGNSYTRYWLPIYLMFIPLAALAIVKISQALAMALVRFNIRLQKIVATGLQAGAVLGLAAIGLIFVLFGSEEGLVFLYHNSLAEKENARQVFALTDSRGIIITQYYDKFFFPERRIIMGRLPQDYILEAAQDLVSHYPVYYYNFYLNEADVTYLNERKLSDYNLKLRLLKKLNARFGLYQLESNLENNSESDYEKP